MEPRSPSWPLWPSPIHTVCTQIVSTALIRRPYFLSHLSLSHPIHDLCDRILFLPYKPVRLLFKRASPRYRHQRGYRMTNQNPSLVANQSYAGSSVVIQPCPDFISAYSTIATRHLTDSTAPYRTFASTLATSLSPATDSAANPIGKRLPRCDGTNIFTNERLSSRESFASAANLRSHIKRKMASCEHCHIEIYQQNMTRHLRTCQSRP